MGFGHRVYKNYDPRAKLMRETCHEVLDELGLHDDPLFKLAMALEKIALEDDYFVSRKLYPNVDFYSGIVQKAIGIPVPLFTAIFALARTVGWIAQLNEMIADPEYKIGRPRQLFTGATRRVGQADRAAVSDGRRRAPATPARRRARASIDRGPHDEQHEGIRSRRSTLFGGNAPFIEELYEHYLADPGGGAAPTGAPTSTRCAAARADVAHAPVDRVVHRSSRKSRKVAGAMVDATTMHKQVLVLQLIGKFRTLGMFHADLDPLQRQEKPLHRRSRPRDLRLHRGRPRHRVRRRLVQGGPGADAPARAHRRR